MSEAETEAAMGSTTTEEEGEDWDVDTVRGVHESDEHWELRKNFLLKNKGSYPKQRLLSLSQVFANHEFLGCRYPEETMDLVAELSLGIVEEYRTARSGRLQRTFVKASDAAERKSKGTRKRMSPSSSAPTPASTMSTTKPGSGSHHLFRFPKVFVRESPSSATPTPTSCGPGDDSSSRENEDPGTLKEKWEAALAQYGDDLRGLILVDQIFVDREGPLQTINRSCGMSHKPFSVDYATTPNNEGIIIVRIGNSFVMEGRGYNKESARQETATRTLEALRQLCYTIEVKASVVSANEFGKTDIDGGNLETKLNGGDNDNALTEDNVGSRLLRLMGWQEGKGLGKLCQGIQTPVSATASSEVVQRSRLGLGMSPSAIQGGGGNFGEGVKQFLLRQIWQCSQFDLQFTPEFSSDERKIIHQVASQLGLRSRSHGKGSNRFLVVSRKVELPELVNELLTLGESAKYRVIPPAILVPTTSSSSLFYQQQDHPPSTIDDPAALVS